MDKALNNNKQEIKIIDRNLIYLTGIEKIISFDSEEFLMESVLGNINLKGENLEIIKLDTHDGVVSIKGVIKGMFYDEVKAKNTESFFTKLFK